MKRDTTLHIGDIGVFTSVASQMLGMNPDTFKTLCGKRRQRTYIARNPQALHDATKDTLCISCLRAAHFSPGAIVWPEEIERSHSHGLE